MQDKSFKEFLPFSLLYFHANDIKDFIPNFAGAEIKGFTIGKEKFIIFAGYMFDYVPRVSVFSMKIKQVIINKTFDDIYIGEWGIMDNDNFTMLLERALEII